MPGMLAHTSCKLFAWDFFCHLRQGQACQYHAGVRKDTLLLGLKSRVALAHMPILFDAKHADRGLELPAPEITGSAVGVMGP